MKHTYFAITLLFFHTFIYGQYAAPIVTIIREDHVATIEMDFDNYAGFGGQLWDVGTTGTDPCGYRVQWWPDPSSLAQIDFSFGCTTSNSAGTNIIATAQNPHQLISPNPVVQIQPIANDVLYHVKVEKLNSLGMIVSPPTILDFNGGDGARVDSLRNTMTFFDDFNLPMGMPDELKWNHASNCQTDPRFNLFFVNNQCHVHTLNGTLNGAAGDKAQVAQRSRKPILIEDTIRRKIVFDMDGIFSDRSVWYLDFNPVNTDLMGHMSFFDEDGDQGLPADVCRIKSQGNDLSVSLINAQGESFQLISSYLPDFGKRLMTNVRRNFDIRLGSDGIQIFVDNVEVINTLFSPNTFPAGIYYPLWSTIGYNTSKDDVPYFLSHWDNFGFDGPDINPDKIHNYKTQIVGSDYQKTNRYNNDTAKFEIIVPDDIHPLVQNAINEIWLVWSYLKNDYSTFSILPIDTFYVNGVSFKMPEGANNSHPLVPELVDYAGSTISNRVKIDEVIKDGPSIITQGSNFIEFFADNTGIVNLHIEVICPYNKPEPNYTPPNSIHPITLHHQLPKLGPSAKIVTINNQEYESIDDTIKLLTSISDTATVEILVGNYSWANWAPNLLHQPSKSAEFWSAGSTNGITKVNLYLRKLGQNFMPGQLVASINTNIDAPAPQVRYKFNFSTLPFVNGDYELFVQAVEGSDILSHPGYHGFGFKFDAEELSGAYTPIVISIFNAGSLPFYKFNGSNGPLWTTDSSWDTNQKPPLGYNGIVEIDANCNVPSGHNIQLGLGGMFTINPSRILVVHQ